MREPPGDKNTDTQTKTICPKLQQATKASELDVDPQQDFFLITRRYFESVLILIIPLTGALSKAQVPG